VLNGVLKYPFREEMTDIIEIKPCFGLFFFFSFELKNFSSSVESININTNVRPERLATEKDVHIDFGNVGRWGPKGKKKNESDFFSFFFPFLRLAQSTDLSFP
jgi:hypothetical protein